MQLFKSRSHYLFVDGEHCLWCGRFDGHMEAKSSSTIENLSNHEFLCHLEGIVGKIQIFPDSEPKLLLILQQSSIAHIAKHHEIFRIDKIGILPLSPTDPAEGDRLFFTGKSDQDNSDTSSDTVSESNALTVNRGVQKTLKTLRQATNLKFGMQNNKKGRSERDKLERRILEDVAKMFNYSQFFYYSLTWDLTNSMQRLFKMRSAGCAKQSSKRPHWRTADERFFWNRHLWKDLESARTPSDDHWIVPVVLGYIQQSTMIIDLNTCDDGGQMHSPNGEYIAPTCAQVTLISRRSRFRAGTRYKRRGIDDGGNCANYVESEQIMEIMNHCLSFVQVRGSIPVFWSQPGMRYRPAPRIDRGGKECHEAFAKHFMEQQNIYKHQVIVNLVEQSGKEKILADAFLHEILNFNSDSLVYVSFDFHEYCRGLRLENIGILIESLQDILTSMRFFWTKSVQDDATEEHVMCQQTSVFRVNCVDCLDRTNVIQASFARCVLESQLRKMGLLLPEIEFPLECRQVLQIMWANNGDVISRQYAGTSALKGDVTRTGERNLGGLMKDGLTSANRYYLHQFKDAYRQAAVDASLGQFFKEESLLVPGVTTSAVDPSEFERVKQLVDDCKKILIPSIGEIPLGGWPMIDADRNADDVGRQDMDTVLILSTLAYYIAEYSDESDLLVGYQRVPLEEVENIEVGPEPAMFRSKKVIIRINYHVGDETGYCHQLKTAGLRFFNSMIMPLNSEEESTEMLRSIAESFRMAIEAKLEKSIPVVFGKMQRKTSRVPPKEDAPVESIGGIFSATALGLTRQEPAKTQLAGVLTAVRNKLIDLNPFERIPFSNRNVRDARKVPESPVSYSAKESENQVTIPEISIDSQSASDDGSDFVVMDLDETGKVVYGHTSENPELSKKNFEILSGSCGIVLGNNVDTKMGSEMQLENGINSPDDIGESPKKNTMDNLNSHFTRKHSRSSEALKESYPCTSPVVLSASPSANNFQNSGVPVSQATIPQQLLNPENAPVRASSSDPGGETFCRSVTASANSNRPGKQCEELRSIRTCRTKIIEL